MSDILKETMRILQDIVVMDENYIRKTLNRESYIEAYLQDNRIDYHVFEFYVPAPDFVKYYLYVDGEQIRVLPDGLRSGKVEISERVKVNLKDSVDLYYEYSYPNINFNSLCDGVSIPNFYNAPALAVSRRDVPKLLNTKDVDAYLDVRVKDVKSKAFLLGNVEDPKRVGVVHYDALWTGAIDNSLSLASVFAMAKHGQLDLKDNMVLLVGFTEVTFYWPEYWDDSFRRVIEEFDFIPQKENIIIDSFGYRNTVLLDLRGRKPTTYAERVFYEAYKIFGERIAGVTIYQEDLFPIYHSDINTVDKVDLKEAEKGIGYIKELLGKGG